jgi:phosphatidylserine/phosphatidylglycerophosphate/cardiolipin synthase-like enzyme
MTRHADWLLTREERANPRTILDDRHPGDVAWSEGNLVRPLIHGATYFAELFERLQATRKGDLVLFTDWAGDADEQLTADPDSQVVDVLGRADERGVDVRGLIWRSHLDKLNFSAEENRTLGEQLQERGAEALLDMRVRTGGSHHQKMIVIRHADDPTRDVAYVGGIDLCHSRRDDAEHLGDPQSFGLAPEYGATPPWHDVMAAISGPAVHDVETVFRERWEDPTRLTRNPLYWAQDTLKRLDTTPDPLPEQQPPPPSPDGATHTVQLLRTYPNLRHGRDYPFARGGERSVARGYTKTLARARDLVYLEDQYVWGRHIGDLFTDALRRNPELRVVAVVPLYTDQAGFMARVPQRLGRARAMQRMEEAGPGRVAVYGIENHESTPVYVHAKVCVVDDTWATIGSDNFNRRSWTHDSELTCAVVDEAAADHSPYARRLRLRLAAEHLDRSYVEDDDDSLLEALSDCLDGPGLFDAYASCAASLDAWHEGGQVGDRPPGRLRRVGVPELSRLEHLAALVPYLTVHDPDGRPAPLKKSDGY